MYDVERGGSAADRMIRAPPVLIKCIYLKYIHQYKSVYSTYKYTKTYITYIYGSYYNKNR